MERKRIVAISIFIFVFFIGIVYLFPVQKSKKISVSKSIENQITTNNQISMMYETSNGSGEYVLSNDFIWPAVGYTYNSILSKCENGSKLVYDEKTKTIVLSANISDRCYVFFDKSPLTLSEICSSGDNLAECIKSLSEKESPRNTYLYLHNESLENSANDGSIRYSGPLYTVTDAHKDKYSGFREIIDKDRNGYILLYHYDDDLNPTEDFVYFETGQAALNQAINDGYLDEVVHNYVCFGSSASVCPHENLYRILGVFGSQVKLIKADYVTSSLLGTDGNYSSSGVSSTSYWGGYNANLISLYTFNSNNGTASNDWENSLLNKTNLNTNFVNNIGANWKNMIASVNWNVGVASTQKVTVKEFYNMEKARQTSNKYQIGLMTVSEYAFATSPDYWGYQISSFGSALTRNNNWLYSELNEWTMIPSSEYGDGDYVFVKTDQWFSEYLGTAIENVRPTFYLNNNVKYISGEGTYHSPYRISS